MRCRAPRACGRWIVGAAAYARRKGREGSGEGQPIDLSREDTSRVRHEGAVRAWEWARTGRGWEVLVTAPGCDVGSRRGVSRGDERGGGHDDGSARREVVGTTDG